MESAGLLTELVGKVGLAVVLALGAAAAFRWVHRGRASEGGSRARLTVVETAALAQNRTLHLVRIGRRKLLIGSTPNQVVMLADLAQEDLEDVAAEAEAAPEPNRPFAQFLKPLLAPSGLPAPSADDNAARLRAAASALRRWQAGGVER